MDPRGDGRLLDFLVPVKGALVGASDAPSAMTSIEKTDGYKALGIMNMTTARMTLGEFVSELVKLPGDSRSAAIDYLHGRYHDAKRRGGRTGAPGLTEEQRKRIGVALESRDALGACEACGRKEFIAGPEIAQLFVAPAPGMITGQTIPTAVVICGHCGNVRLHALAILQLLELGRRV